MESKTVHLILFFIFFISPQFHSSNAQTWIRAGYWYASGESPIPDINSALFTHLICGFANVSSSSYQLIIPSADQQYYSSFTGIVRRRNPSVITLLSIWNGQASTAQGILGDKVNSSVLSSMLIQSSSRRSFIESSIKTARHYGFRGIDLFWLWPNTATDMINMGKLLDEWRAAVDSEPRNSSRSKLMLTMAVKYVPSFRSMTYPVESMKRNLDFAHVVAYDYHLPLKENVTGAHAALYNPTSHVNTDYGIRQWLNSSFPASKLVMGLAYHGYAWTLMNPKDSEIGSPAAGVAVTQDGSMSYKYLKWYTGSYKAKIMYNASYVVNYCIIGLIWIGFDDVEAIRAKIAYVKEKKLLGYNVFLVTNDDNWELSRAAEEEAGQQNKKRLLVIVLVTIAMTIILLVLGATMCSLQRRVLESIGFVDNIKRSVYRLLNIVPRIDSFDSNAPNLQVFSYTTIKAATNNFSSQNKLGEGGFGPVYKGTLRKGQQIAVKRLSKTSNQGLEEFHNEVTLTATLHHVNLVRVLGYCTKREEKMLIYEYMPNKSLDHYPFDPTRGNLLDWEQRVHIIEGVIQGLLYLQEYSNSTIIHRDIKASNILLDDEMNPKISDFGLARAFGKNEHEANTGRIVGTYGYVPPEYVRRGIYSMKYDVYSFGVLLLQIISGKRSSCFYGLDENLNILEHAYELWKEGRGMDFVDPTLDDSISRCKLLRCMEVALLCVQENPVDRPSMLEVSSMLKNESAAIINPKRPAFSVKKDEDEDNMYKSVEEIYSVNDATVSEIVPR